MRMGFGSGSLEKDLIRFVRRMKRFPLIWRGDGMERKMVKIRDEDLFIT